MNGLDFESKGFEDPETGIVYEIYNIHSGEKIQFNLDGAPFKFKSFIMVTSRLGDKLTSLFIHVPSVPIDNLFEIIEFLGEDKIPLPIEEIENMYDATVRFNINQEALSSFLNPRFNSVKDLKEFLAIEDDIGGSVVLDFYYYDISIITDPYAALLQPQGMED